MITWSRQSSSLHITRSDYAPRILNSHNKSMTSLCFVAAQAVEARTASSSRPLHCRGSLGHTSTGNPCDSTNFIIFKYYNYLTLHNCKCNLLSHYFDIDRLKSLLEGRTYSRVIHLYSRGPENCLRLSGTSARWNISHKTNNKIHIN